MALSAGTHLGPYEIVAPLGAGGMGEIYKAKDTRLNRTVAIKVLPPHVASNPELKQRFEREAKTLAALSHPHICPVFDIGYQDGIDFLVMEHLEGETLAARLTKGPLPVEQVLRHAIDIADALDKAHRKGVTHRDLKPGNIMLTKSGAKLLDFGLAKLKQGTAPAAALSGLPTGDDPITAEGTILGTLQYMSPEQVEGKETDARADIFAFGAVVYEMATGKRAFEGKSQASVMAKILEHDPPPISSLQPMTPPALDRVVTRCLAKDPDDRWQTARDLEVQLKWIAEGGGQIAPRPLAPAHGVPALGRRALILSLSTLLLGAGIAGVAIWFLKPAPPQQVSRFAITLPSGAQLGGGLSVEVVLSPDGSQLAYLTMRDGTRQLYLRAIGSLEARPIPGTEGAWDPFFSPDGQWLGFWAGGKIKKVSVNGGAALTVADAADARGASWGSQGTIIFAPSPASVLMRVPEEGGKPQPLTQMAQGETTHRDPAFLPGGNAVLFAAWGATGPTDAKVAVQVIETGERRDLIQAAIAPRYAASGHLLYVQGQTLMAVPFDPERLEIRGAAVPVVEGVALSVDYSISTTGSLVHVPPGQAAQRTLVWVSRNRAEEALGAPARPYGQPRLSPDGRQLAVEIGPQIWVYDLVRETLTRLTFEGTANGNHTWTPDGKRIAFQSNKDGVPAKIFWQLADGSGEPERLTSGAEGNQTPQSWSPDGQLLAFHHNHPTTQRDIWVFQLSDRKAQPFLRTTFTEGGATFSPDGRWVAYVSDESGRPEVYVQPYPRTGGKWQISTDGGTERVWARNGRELFYRSGNKMMAVETRTQPSFSAGKPRMLFEGQYLTNGFPFMSAAFDVSADGQRFLMVKETDQAASPTQITVVLNWFEELKRRVPTNR